MRIMMTHQHHLLIGALYNEWSNTRGSPLNPHHSHHQSTQATSIQSQHHCPPRTAHRCAATPSSTKYREHYGANRPSTAHLSLHLPRFPRTKKTKRTPQRRERRRAERAVNVLARCGKTSSSRLRRHGTAVCPISSCLKKTRMMCLGRLSRRARLRRPQSRLPQHEHRR